MLLKNVPAGHKVATPRAKTRRAGSALWRGDRVCQRAISPPASRSTCTISDRKMTRAPIRALQPRVPKVDFYPPEQMRYFEGFRRPDGRVGTRNYIALVSTVNCSASVTQFARERFRDVAAGLSRHRRRDRADPQVGMRAGARRRRSSGFSSACWPDTRGIPTWRRTSSSGWAARSTRRRPSSSGTSSPSATIPENARPSSPFKKPAVFAKAVDGGGQRRGAAASPRQRGAAHEGSRCPSSSWPPIAAGSDGNSGITANPALGLGGRRAGALRRQRASSRRRRRSTAPSTS